ncbi:fatty acid/sphingolipid desaturase [Daldinia decipiens]|uniref:fatty acid/sphingolipid desaturase n=1 Tax=Daldinia decipiens TaxID=326647 RepID=UPI0020C39272|nr:fatty acid/sphingolipid desaturase [Daldinia decipiens]KAI1656131.1 fatty acid/sphingolipid desaturase [Daldinia decipiens]
MAEKAYPLLSRRQIEGLIADGRRVFIANQYVFKADPWLPYHPGGDKAILHMVGRDATDEVTALHSAETRERMNRYRIGRIEGRWTNFIPPVQGGKFRPLLDGDEIEDEVEEGDVISTGASSSPSSREPSPVFDDSAEAVIRKRRGVDGLAPKSSSTCSVSSVEPDDDGMSYLDTVTREKMTLDLEKYPSLDFDTQDAIVAKYRDLGERIKAEDLYKCNYWAYAIEVTRYSILFSLTFLFLHWGWYVASAVCLGAFWHQLVFTAHDAGHMGITHGFHTDTVIGIIVADFFGGLSIGWWKRNHNVHHIVTNAPEHDPDIEHMPFMAVSHRFFTSMRSTFYDRVMEYDAVAKFMLRIQPYTYYVLLLFGRLNLYRLSWDFLLARRGPTKGPAWWHGWLEITGQLCFITWYFYGVLYKSIPNNSDRLVFFLISHMVPMPVHAQICLSHFAMSTSDMGPHESFPQKMLRTTMDIECPQWLDFFHGGLQFQVIHHLFPRIPRHNLRRTQKLVQDFCNDVGIPYALYGFVDGNKQVVGTLAEVSRQAAILAKCQKVISEGDDPIHGHHH